MVSRTIIGLNTAIHDGVIELLASERRGTLVDLGAGDGTLTERLRKEEKNTRAAMQKLKKEHNDLLLQISIETNAS